MRTENGVVTLIVGELFVPQLMAAIAFFPSTISLCGGKEGGNGASNMLTAHR